MNLTHRNLFRIIKAAASTLRNPAMLKLLIAEKLTVWHKAAVVPYYQINAMLPI